MHDDAAWVRRLLSQLTDRQEATRASPWSINDAPAAYVAKSVHAIVGLEVRVETWEASWNLSQNRPPSEIDGVVACLRAYPHWVMTLLPLLLVVFTAHIGLVCISTVKLTTTSPGGRCRAPDGSSGCGGSCQT